VRFFPTVAIAALCRTTISVLSTSTSLATSPARRDFLRASARDVQFVMAREVLQ